MGRRRTITTETFEPEPEFTERPAVRREPVEDDSVFGRVSEITDGIQGSRLHIKVYRVVPGGNDRFLYGQDGESAARNMEAYTQKIWKAGDYIAKVFVDDRLIKSVPFAVGDPPPEVVSEIASVSSAPAPSVEVQLLRQEIQFLREQQQRGHGDGGERSNFLDAVRALKELQGMGASSNDPMETFLKGVEFGRSAHGGDGSGDTLTEIIKTLGPAVAPHLMAGLAGRGGGGGNGMADDTGKAALPEGPKVNGSGGAAAVLPEEESMLKFAIAYLKRKCELGSNPAFYVEYVLDNAEMPDVQALVRKIRTESFESFVSVDPEIAKEPYAKFFRALYDGLRSEFEQGNYVDLDSSGPGGNAGDSSGHAKTGKGRGRAS